MSAHDVTDVAIITLLTWHLAAILAVILWHLAVTACKHRRPRLGATRHHYPRPRYRRRG